MKKLSIAFLCIATVAGGGLLYAQSQMGHGSHGHMNHGTAGHGASGAHADHGATSDDPVISAYMAVNEQMHRDMDIEFTGNADIDFVRGMIPHHQGAIDMAKVVLQFGTDTDIRALAEEVIEAQESEIAMMRAWLAARGVD